MISIEIALILALTLCIPMVECLGVQVSFSQPKITKEPLDATKPIDCFLTLTDINSSYTMSYYIVLEVGSNNNSGVFETYESRTILPPNSFKEVKYSILFNLSNLNQDNFTRWIQDPRDTSTWTDAWYRVRITPRVGDGVLLKEETGRPRLAKPFVEYFNPSVSSHKNTALISYDYQITVNSTLAEPVTLEAGPFKNGPWFVLGTQEYNTTCIPKTLKWSNITPDFNFIRSYYRFVSIAPSRVFIGPTRDFQEIDKHALNAPYSVKTNTTTLASYLTSKSKDDVEKVRAIYRWITANIAYDTSGYFSGSYGDLSPEGVLKGGKSICAGYSDLFENLSKTAGLETVTISGYAKGYNYDVGDRFSGSPNHAWNAVKLNGTWYLLDSTWGAGHVRDGSFVREFDDHYFLTSPDEFIFEHYPEDTKWQLLDPPQSLDKFENLFHARPTFFKLGLEVENTTGTISTDKELQLRIIVPDDVFLIADTMKGDQKLNTPNHHLVKKNGFYDLSISFDQQGDYVIRLFARKGGESGNYDGAVDCRVIVTKA